MMPARVWNQDPAGDGARRAARAGESLASCPYPEGNWLGERWRAAYIAECQRLGRKAPVQRKPGPRIGDWYSFEALASVASLDARGHDASYIATALRRKVGSVREKIEALRAGELRIPEAAE
jgi:hypothetical protein